MKIKILREVLKNHDASLYNVARKFFFVEDIDIAAFRAELASLSSLADDHELTSVEILAFVKIAIKATNSDFIRYSAMWYEARLSELFNIYRCLNALNILTVEFYELLLTNDTAIQNLKFMFDPFVSSQANLERAANLLSIFSKEVRQFVTNFLYKIATEKYSSGDYTAFETMLLTLDRYEFLKPSDREKIIGKLSDLQEFAKCVALLDKMSLLNRNTFTVLLEKKYLRETAKFLSELDEYQCDYLDEELFIKLTKMYIDTGTNKALRSLLKSGYVNKPILVAIVNNSIKINSLYIEQLIQRNIVNHDLIEKLIMNAKYNTDTCLKILLQCDFFKKELLTQLLSDPVKWEMFCNILNILDKNKIVTSATVEAVVNVSRDNMYLQQINSILSDKLSGLSESMLIKIANKNRLNTIASLIANDKNGYLIRQNRQALFSLSEEEFNFIYNFMVNEKKQYSSDQYCLNQETLDALILIAKNNAHQNIQQKQLTLSQLIGTLNKPNSNNEKQVLDLIHDNFYAYAQDIMRITYLQPFPDNNGVITIKNDTQQGIIERPVHGAMHAGRVTLYADILHHFIAKLLPNYVNESVSTLSNSFNLTATQILTLTKLTALAHDAARRGDNQDLWDKESAQFCEQLMVHFGINKKIALIFSKMIEFKDDSKKFTLFLKEQGLQQPEIVAFSYLRKLIQLADCLDIMRCTGRFYESYVYDVFADMDGYTAAHHDDAIHELYEQSHALIASQKDMQFPCTMILKNNTTIKKDYIAHSYDIQDKTNIEHADNVLNELLLSFLKTPYFKQFITDRPIAPANNVKRELPFNPLIHGTTSLLFVNLDKTDNKLLPVRDMLESFNLAPMGGEISGGGLEGMNGGMELSFGLFSVISRNTNTYDFEKVTSNYASYTMCKEKTASTFLGYLKDCIDFSKEHAFYNLTRILVYLARAKQLGASNQDIEKIAGVNQFVADIKTSIKFAYLLLLIGEHISLDYKKINLTENKLLIIRELYHFKKKFFLEKIEKSNIDIKAIYENPTAENLQMILPLFALSSDNKDTENTKMLDRQYFKLTHSNNNVDQDKNDVFTTVSLDLFEIVYKEEGSLGGLLYHSYDDESPCNRFSHTFSQQYISSMSKRLNILENILSHDYQPLSERALFFNNNRFPLILILDDAKKAYQFSNQHEYRTAALTLGSDIKLIATDNEQHRLMIMKYFDQNNIHNVSVVLFDDLYLSKFHQQTPTSPYTHADHTPRLSWLAAKALPKQPAEEQLPADDVKLKKSNVKKYK